MSFSRLFSRPNKPVYLGNVFVIPRSTIKRLIDFEVWDFEITDHMIERKIATALTLPSEKEGDSPPDGYLVIDLIVSDYMRGTGAHFIYTELFLLGLLFRPKIVIVSRLRDGSSGKIKYSTKTSKRMSVKEYLAEGFDFWRIFWVWKRDEKILDRLMLECLLENIGRVRSHT